MRRSNIAGRTLATTVRYSGVSGDLNPIHYDPEAARRAGFERVLVHGAYLGAFLENAAQAALNDRQPCEYKVRYVRPILVGDDFVVCCDAEGDSVRCSIEGPSGADDFRVTGELRVAPSEPVGRPDDFEIITPPYPWTAELGVLRLFMEATRDEAVPPTAETRLPLTFLATVGRCTSANQSVVRRLGFAYDRMLHGETIIQIFGAPVRVGETCQITEAHGNRHERPHRTGTIRFGDAIHEISDAEGKIRARVFNRMIERSNGTGS